MNKTTKISGWLVMAAAWVVMTMMTMTACSSEGDDILGGNGSEQPKETAGVRVTVSAGISDGEGTTRSAVTKDDKGRRTLKFTTGDRLHIYAVLQYDYRPLRLMTGLLNMQGAPTGDDLQASFSGELTVYKWDGSKYIEDPDQTVKDGDAPAADPLAVSYEYCNEIGQEALFSATLVHKDAGSNFTTYADKTDFYFGMPSYKLVIAPDVETLMTSTLLVYAFNYDKKSHGINLNETSYAIFNCAVSGLPSDGDYEVSMSTTYDKDPEPIGTVTVAGGAAAFAFQYFAFTGDCAYKINLTKGTDTYTIDLGTRELTTKVYNVTRYWTGAEFIKAEPKEIPLTVQALTDGTIVVNNPQQYPKKMKYSLNGGDKTTMSSTTTIDVSQGDKVQFYGEGTRITSYRGTTIAGGTAQVKVYGNIMSLVDETGFATNTTLTESNTFPALFAGNANLTDASGLLLPATTMKKCCYYTMFADCTSLTTAPALPAETLAENCYGYMFSGCSSLTAAPELPAETLAQQCYKDMFYGCTSLTTAPELPAETLAQQCYYEMFYGCSNLTSVTCLATDISAYFCTKYWLSGVSASGTFTKAATMTGWTTNSTSGIPSGWTVKDAE